MPVWNLRIFEGVKHKLVSGFVRPLNDTMIFTDDLEFLILKLLEDQVDLALILSFEQNWVSISRSKFLSMRFIRKFHDQIYWKAMVFRYKIPDDLLIQYQDRLNWVLLSKFQRLSEPIIERFADKVYWKFISISQVLSEEFILKHRNSIVFEKLGANQILSEYFILMFQDKLNFQIIRKHQVLSKAFLERYHHLFD